MPTVHHLVSLTGWDCGVLSFGEEMSISRGGRRVSQIPGNQKSTLWLSLALLIPFPPGLWHHTAGPGHFLMELGNVPNVASELGMEMVCVTFRQEHLRRVSESAELLLFP